MEFSHMLQGSLEKWRADGGKGVWLTVPIHLGKFISAAALQGFQFHHAEEKTAMLCQWLPVDVSSTLPIYATHQVGVAGCVLNEKTRELLIMKDKHSVCTQIRCLVAWCLVTWCHAPVGRL
ncbi:PREDICTED: nucleoside diphosphate-linked moiety X motif 6-like [Priapulus caudatus]|uniref:Nucleoside diphosphate-linked moiety X motif 6-like n=1 Tax=Priapulus caudatus TaxID=37621 RepID=A0ABM1ESK7_PRICU|nr:PREDICTED: nucleoside diphosphate-linked moiety X motif 6-like [Priapulus caudatus]